MAAVCQSGARIRSMDIGVKENQINQLQMSIDKLCKLGYDAKLWHMDSMTIMAAEIAERDGPYDFIFIDGDHTYEGVKSDWQTFKDMATLIGFHDVGPNTSEPEVRRFWLELCETYLAERIEIIDAGDSWGGGIGLIWP